MPDGGLVRAEFDPSSFRDFMASVKAFDPKLARALRKKLRKAGEETVTDMKGVVGSGDLRGGISGGIRTAVATGKSRQGVSIESTGNKLGPQRKGMHRAWNKGSFRHPVYGNKNKWVHQSGNRFFGGTIRKHEDDMREAVLDALDEALKEMS
jgi:hypothetical protein